MTQSQDAELPQDAKLQVRLLTPEDGLLAGDASLIERWRATNDAMIWVDIQASPSEAEKELLKSFGCHPLAIKDAYRLRHPPKVEFFENQTFLLFRGISSFNDKLDFNHLQIALFVGERFIITRHYSRSYSIDHWLNADTLAHLLQQPSALALRILLYSSGKYLEQMLEFEESLSELEDQMQQHADDDMLRELILYKTRLRKLRRVFDYHQKLTATLLDTPSDQYPADNDELRHIAQDLFERCERLHSLSSMYFEICGDLIDGYLSISSHQLNLTMRVLTVITAIFVPLGFIAGLYGMNFENMPELKNPYAYFITLGVMISTASTLLIVFWKKRWL